MHFIFLGSILSLLSEYCHHLEELFGVRSRLAMFGGQIGKELVWSSPELALGGRHIGLKKRH